MQSYYKIVESSDKHFSFDFVAKRTTHHDWSAMYLQTSIEHALNYLTHKAYLTKTNYLLLVELQTTLNYIRIDDPLFGSSVITGDSKSKLLKDKFKIDDNLLLMDNMTNPLLLLDTLCDYELIVPHYLFNTRNFKITLLKTYKVNSKTIANVEIKTTKEIQNIEQQ